MSYPHNESPVNPLPPVVVALCLVVIGIEVVFSLGARGLIGGPGAVGWRLEHLQLYSFAPQIFDWMLETRQFPAEHVIRLASYPFIHGSFTHALFACVMLLALGKMVAEAMGALAFVLVFFLSAIGAAVVYATVLSDPPPLFGAFPAIYGLIGAYTYLLWLTLGQMGETQVRAFSLIGFLLGIQLLFGLLFGGGVDWVADLAGFAIGFGLAVFLVPGGFARILQKLRRD